MNISILDGSNYFKGLLLLIRKDNKITKDEHILMTRVGRNLGFEKKFIENAISEIINNKYISTTPPLFTTRELAEKFLKDGIILAASDNEIHHEEEDWLLSVAEKNNIEKQWFTNEKEKFLQGKNFKGNLESDNLKVLY